MKRILFVACIATLALSFTASAQIDLKIWHEATPGDDGNFDHLQNARDIVLSRPPDVIENVDRLAFWGRGENDYISSMDGVLLPPVTGDYVFSVYGDDHNGLYLSPDADPAHIADMPVCYVDGWSNEGQWDAKPTSNSDPIFLEAGKAYAFRTVQRQGGGGEGFGCGWAGPGFDRQIITAEYVAQGLFVPLSPKNGAEHVSDITLSWMYLNAAEGVTYTVHFGSNPDMLMPLATPNTELPLGAVGSPITPFDTVLYWKVVASDGQESPLWSFTTEHDRPQFENLEGAFQPQPLALKVGEEGSLSCNAVTFLGSDVSYQWYMVNPDGDDLLLEGATENTLTAVVEMENDGDYYCVATSAAGSTQSNTVMVDVQQGLIHRYTFNDGDVAEVDGKTMILDVVGGADAVLYNGTGNATVADGQVILGNTNTHGSCDFVADDPDDNNPDGDFVDLPNGLISSLGAMTVECWSTWDDDDRRIWQRIWTFGTSNCGEGSSCAADQAGPKLITLIPYNNNGDVQMETRNPQTTLIPGGQVPLHGEIMTAVTVDDIAGIYRLYVNGIPRGMQAMNLKLKDIPDINNWLGRSQWCDPMYVGSFNEFRIWDTALSAEAIMANYLAGPDAIGSVPEREPCDDHVIGDVNGDCVVDIGDAALIIEQFITDQFYAD